MQESIAHPTVASPAREPSIVDPPEPPEEEGEARGISAASVTATAYSDCEPHGFGSRYGYSPR